MNWPGIQPSEVVNSLLDQTLLWESFFSECKFSIYLIYLFVVDFKTL